MALANLRMLFVILLRLDSPLQIAKLPAADWLLGHGLIPRKLMRELGLNMAALDAVAGAFGRYNPDQPRVPAGGGAETEACRRR